MTESQRTIALDRNIAEAERRRRMLTQEIERTARRLSEYDDPDTAECALISLASMVRALAAAYDTRAELAAKMQSERARLEAERITGQPVAPDPAAYVTLHGGL